MIKGFIFDMDGVLIDTMEAHYHAWQKFFKIKKFNSFTKEMFLSFAGEQNKEILEGYKKRYNVDVNPDTDGSLKESLVDVSEFKIFQDVIQTLKKLKKHFKLAVATSATEDIMRRNLSLFKLENYFYVFITASDVKFSKPNPDIFLKAAKKLKLNPKQCIVVEDAINGVKAAKSAGMKCIAVTNTFPREKLKKAGADLVVDKLSEINPDKIKNL